MTRQTRGGYTISQIKQIQSRIFEKLLKANDIEDFNGAQGRILFVLWQSDNVPIRELSEKTSLAKTTLTSMLDRMEKIGVLRRVLDPADRRLVRIVLTAKARAMHDRYQAVSTQMTAIFYKDFSDDEIVRFEQMLERILNNLKDYEGEDHGPGHSRPDHELN